METTLNVCKLFGGEPQNQGNPGFLNNRLKAWIIAWSHGTPMLWASPLFPWICYRKVILIQRTSSTPRSMKPPESNRLKCPKRPAPSFSNVFNKFNTHGLVAPLPGPVQRSPGHKCAAAEWCRSGQLNGAPGPPVVRCTWSLLKYLEVSRSVLTHSTLKYLELSCHIFEASR